MTISASGTHQAARTRLTKLRTRSQAQGSGSSCTRAASTTVTGVADFIGTIARLAERLLTMPYSGRPNSLAPAINFSATVGDIPNSEKI